MSKHITENQDDTGGASYIKKPQSVKPRNAPVQGRSKLRSKQIIDVTGELLERVGFDDLNTIIIAKEVGISIGSLYHYFPNKHAILHAMGTRWLDEIKTVLHAYESWDIENLPLEELVEKMLAKHVKVYKKQKAILTLVQAMFSVPELRELDTYHDDLVIEKMAHIFKRMGINHQLKERQRLGRVYLEMTHSLFLVVAHMKGERAKRTMGDLNFMVLSWIRRYQD